MRILLLGAVDLSKPGGLETHLLELSRCLTARGHEVDVYGEPRALPPHRMVSTVDPARYDIIHDHGGWPTGLRPAPCHVRTLHFCVAAKMETYVRIGRLRTLLNPGNWRARTAERAAVLRAQRFIAVSRRVQREFERHHRLDPARTVVIPNGASFEPPRVPRAEWRARQEIAPDTPVLLTIGRSDFVKGYDILRRAWPRVRAAVPNALWVIAGGGGEGRSQGLRVTGSLPRHEIANWIHAADVGALPSYYEGCSVALLEMLAGGLPSLAHDVGNAADVIRDGADGAIVPRNADAWASALASWLARGPRDGVPPGAAPGTFALLGAGYRWERIAEQVESVYRDFAGPSGSA